jgi:hypothetical protein
MVCEGCELPWRRRPVTDHADDDVLLALALDDVADSERESVLEHLAGCASCRHEYDMLSATVEHTLAAAPRIEPSPGFDRRALDAMGFGHGTATAGGEGVHRPRWRLVAAGVAAGLVVGLGGTALVSAVRDEPAPTAPNEAGAPLTTDAGERVGTVTAARLKDKEVLVVSVHTGKPGMEYECRLRLADGREVSVGAWTLGDRYGGTWVVRTRDRDVVQVSLVTDDGHVWSTADL